MHSKRITLEQVKHYLIMNPDLSVKVLVAGCIIAAIVTLIPPSDGGDADMPLDLIDCKKIMMRIAKRTLKQFGICTRELKVNVSGDLAVFEKKLGCSIKCTLFKLDLLNEEGKVTKEKIQKFMDEMVPEDAHDFGHAITSDCMLSYGEKLDPNEEFCESYSEYAQCMQGTMADVADKTGCHPGHMG